MNPILSFDGHNDTLTRLYQKSDPFLSENPTGHIDLPRAKKGGLAGGMFAIFTPAPPDSPERDLMFGVTFTDTGYVTSERSPIDRQYAQAFTDANLALAQHWETDSRGAVAIVRTYADLHRCMEQGIFALVLALEGAEAIAPDLSNLDAYYQQGVRSIGLVWSRPNAFAHGVPFAFPGSPDTGAGLTDSGKALVRACNRLGIVVDLAHLNEQGFREVAELSTAPLVVTHADVHAICPSTRNLTDAQIDAVGRSGGVIGINFEAMNTHPQSSIDQDVPLTQIKRHIDYIANRIGVDHVAFGSDFDGADMPNTLKDVAGLPALIDTLRTSGYSEADLEKIACKNWLRVFQQTWKD